MKNLSIKLDLRVITTKVKSNSAFVFYFLLCLVFIFEIFILYTTVKKVVEANKAPDGIVLSKGVRLNLTGFEESVKRINSGKTYYPNPPLYEDPFGTH